MNFMKKFFMLVCLFAQSAFLPAHAQERLHVDTIQSSWHESAAEAREEALEIWRERFFGVIEYGGKFGHFEGLESGSIESVTQESTGKFLKKGARIFFSSLALIVSLGALEIDREAMHGNGIRTDVTYYRMSMPIYFVAN